MPAIQRSLPVLARVTLGLIFVVFGLNGFLGFLPQPEVPPAGGAFLGALAESEHFFPLLKGTEVLMGLLLLANRLVPLALVVLAPVIVHIVAFHVFLAPGGWAMLAVLVAAEGYLAWAYRDAFRGVLLAKAKPAAAEAPAGRWVEA